MRDGMGGSQTTGTAEANYNQRRKKKQEHGSYTERAPHSCMRWQH